MKRIALTDFKVQQMEAPPTGKRIEVFDSLVPGLLVRVSTGEVSKKVVRSFMLRARFPGNADLTKRKPTTNISRVNPVRRAIGTFGKITTAQARETARLWWSLIERGIDPKTEIQRQRRVAQQERDATFGAVFEEWAARHASTKRRGKRMLADVRLLLLPYLKDRPITALTSLEIKSLMQDLKERHGMWQTRSALVLLKSILNRAVDLERYGLAVSPALRITVKSIVGQLPTRQRVLSNDELRAVALAINEQPEPWSSLFAVLVRTGQRRSEIAGLRFRFLDFDRRTLTVPADVYKTGTVHVLALTDTVLSLLRARPRGENNEHDYVYSFNGGRSPVRSFDRAVKHLKATAAKLMGKEPAELSWTLHDWRRTFRTRLAELRVPDTVAEYCIGHKPQGIASVYNQHFYLAETKEAFEKYERFVLDLISPRPARKVVAMRGRR